MQRLRSSKISKAEMSSKSEFMMMSRAMSKHSGSGTEGNRFFISNETKKEPGGTGTFLIFVMS